MDYHRQVDTIALETLLIAYVCTYPDCPNYGMLQIAMEDMPKEALQCIHGNPMESVKDQCEECRVYNP